MAMAEGGTTLVWGCIVSEELGAVGAGSPGWLDDPALVVAMGRGLVALGKQKTLVVIGWTGAHDGAVGAGFTVAVPCADASERITALEWLLWDSWSALAVSTSAGTLCFYAETGDLLIKQNINVGSIYHLHVRCNHNNYQTHNSAEELSVAFRNFIVRIDALDLQSQLRRRLHELGNRRKSQSDRQLFEAESTKLAYQMWNIKSSSSVWADAAITCILPPSLFEQESRQRYFCAITVGTDSTVAAFRLSEDRKHSLTGLLLSKLVPATVSTISSFTKAFRRSEPAPEARPTDVKPQDFSRASLITALKDPPRKGESLALSPNCSLAAVTDSLGRVLLVDVHALVVVRLWKGYRDAHCRFLEAPLDGTSGLQTQMQHCTKEDFCLCLAIHAPRRGTVEIWKLRNGPRLSVIRCPQNSRLLQPSCKFWTSATSDDSYAPLSAYILSGDSGVLSLINPFMPSTGK